MRPHAATDVAQRETSRGFPVLSLLHEARGHETSRSDNRLHAAGVMRPHATTVVAQLGG